MLVPFVIDADSLTPDPGWTPAQALGYHISLLKTWQRIGVLKHDTDKFETSRLYQAIEKLPQKIRPQWLGMLKSGGLLTLTCGNEWNGNITPKNINQLHGIVQIALIDDANAEIGFELDENILSTSVQISPSIEICRISAAEHAKTFEDAIAKSTAHIQTNDKYTDIWIQRFKSLACANIKNISIVDRYSIAQLFNPPPNQLSGLDRFLRLLDKDASGIRFVTLFASWANISQEIRMPEIENELNLIISKLENKKINSFKLIMLPNKAFGKLSHDRFIRFENFVWEFGVGLKIFEGLSAPERSSATFKTGQLVIKEFKDIEDELKKHIEAKFAELKT